MWRLNHSPGALLLVGYKQHASGLQTPAHKTQTSRQNALGIRNKVQQPKFSNTVAHCPTSDFLWLTKHFLQIQSNKICFSPVFICLLLSSSPSCPIPIHSSISYLLSFFKHPKERSHGTNVQGMCGHSHDMVQNPCYLSKQHCETERQKVMDRAGKMAQRVKTC